MNTRRLFISLVTLALGFGLSLFAEDKATPAKPGTGYTVVLEMKITEAGTVDDAKVITSDDTSVDHVLERMAMEAARGTKLPPRLKDGKAVAYTARAPFVFGVEGDEGPESNNAPKPSLHGPKQLQPVYPADLAAKGEVGGSILELVIAADGKLASVKALRSSHPEFEQSAIAAVKQWDFTPAKKDGVPVESRWRIAISFETDALSAEWKWHFPPRPSLGSYAVVRRTLPDQPPAGTAPASAPEKPEEKPAGK
jgi:TonB family protein